MTTVGNINWYSHYENSMEVPQKMKEELHMIQQFHLCYISEWRVSVPPCLLSEELAQLKCPLTDEWIKKMFVRNGRTSLLRIITMTSSTLWKAEIQGILPKNLWFHIVGAFIVSLRVTAFYKLAVAQPRKKTCIFLEDPTKDTEGEEKKAD